MKHNNLCVFFMIAVLFYPSCMENKKNRIVEEFYPDGTIKSEIEMTDTVRNGIVKYYSDQGHLLSTAEYKNDKREGWVINYNPENGKITTKAFYKNDEQNGEVIQNYKEGMLFRTSTYINGRVNGVIKTYWPNGQLKAENTFITGNPAIGLKEFNKEGKVIKQPVILVNEINQSILLNKVILKFSLSDGNKDVDFYLDDLVEGKYFKPVTYKLRNNDGISSFEYAANRGNKLLKDFSIIAKAKTNYGNTLILQRYYKLNKFN